MPYFTLFFPSISTLFFFFWNKKQKQSGCTDNNAASCSATNSSLTLTCAKFYALVSGLCQPSQFARYLGVAIAGFDIPNGIHEGITSESSCAAICSANNPLNGPYQVIQYYPSVQQCACKFTAALAYSGFVPLNYETSSLVGSCASYVNNLPASSNFCQDVIYSATGCIGK